MLAEARRPPSLAKASSTPPGREHQHCTKAPPEQAKPHPEVQHRSPRRRPVQTAALTPISTDLTANRSRRSSARGPRRPKDRRAPTSTREEDEEVRRPLGAQPVEPRSGPTGPSSRPDLVDPPRCTVLHHGLVAPSAPPPASMSVTRAGPPRRAPPPPPAWGRRPSARSSIAPPQPEAPARLWRRGPPPPRQGPAAREAPIGGWQREGKGFPHVARGGRCGGEAVLDVDHLLVHC
jgi:hypothetical protein